MTDQAKKPCSPVFCFQQQPSIFLAKLISGKQQSSKAFCSQHLHEPANEKLTEDLSKEKKGILVFELSYLVMSASVICSFALVTAKTGKDSLSLQVSRQKTTYKCKDKACNKVCKVI